MRVTPLPVTEDPTIKCQPVDALSEWSADGHFLAFVEKEGVRVLKADGGAQVFRGHSGHLSAGNCSCRDNGFEAVNQVS